MIGASFYNAGDSPVHRADARAKIAVLFAYSVALLCASSWLGVGVLVALLAAGLLASHIPPGPMLVSLVPVFVLAGFSLVFNLLNTPHAEGLSSGLLVGLRMVALVAASLLVCHTTTADALLAAFRSFLAPGRRLRIPVDDIACTLALSIRFIPLVELELARIRNAQNARGAELGDVPLSRKLSIWAAAFGGLFVGLFRHADAIASALDARCFGAVAQRTSLSERPFGALQGCILIVAMTALIAFGVAF